MIKVYSLPFYSQKLLFDLQINVCYENGKISRNISHIIFLRHLIAVIQLTQRQFLAGIGWQGESQNGHAGNQDTRHDQVEEIVKSPPSDDHHERYIYIRFWAAIVINFVSFTGHPCNETMRKYMKRQIATNFFDT